MREALKSSLESMCMESRARLSSELCHQITSSDLFKQARTILVYASLPEEVSLDTLIVEGVNQSKTVCVPRMSWGSKTMEMVQIRNLDEDLEKIRYGLRAPPEHLPPLPNAKITLALIPGLGFDRDGHRLGRGAGFYDRWIQSRRDLAQDTLGKSKDCPITVMGVCFDQQIVDLVPTDEHDQQMDQVVTPTTQYTR
ncbi:MAG: 5-formyltetrahydrofolate cyclo-ligase [Phycisphaerales bacterium]